MSTYYYLTPNQQTNGKYTGLAFVFDSSGGFTIDQAFPGINLNTYSPVAQYNVTDAIQIKFSVRTFNDYIGVIKDESNNETISVLFDVSSETLGYDSITISTDDFLNGISTKSIMSMGKMATLYSDFNYTVMEYFGAPYGFSSVFENATDFNANEGIFDASAFVHVVNGINFDNIGSIITDLSGFFTVNDLNKHLRFVCGTNVFGNRPAEGNYGLPNGFMPGDLIYIPNGIKITLSVGVEQEPYLPIYNVGPLNLDSVDDIINYSDQQANVRKITSSTLSNITQSYSVPILIILSNEDTFNFANFGLDWTATAANIGNKKWLAISISALGKYQSAIEESGGIYISSNYGKTWTLSYSIGINTTNCISISETGQYQTASNGIQIYISNNYGNTWSQVYSLGSSKIFVSISLNGKYQSILSCGDSVYTSNNYGLTWSRLSDDHSDLYNSIETFPTGGISLSYSGQYQTIASETIYVSTDYGQSWRDVFAGQYFNDHNWDGIALSSTGQYQTAVDSTSEIYTSSDYGNTWIFSTGANVQDKEWMSVAITANGKFQTVTEKYGTIYSSTNYGATWRVARSTLIANKVWQHNSISANGQYQSAVEYGGSIYVSNLI